MATMRAGVGFVLIALVIWSILGCRRGPKPPPPPPLNPGKVGKRAIEQYDTNSDNVLDAEEIAKCPALEMAMERVDMDGDGKLSADEITKRVQVLKEASTRLFEFGPRVTLDGVGLEGATVTLEPEEFLGDEFQPSTGVTDEIGDVVFTGPNERFPNMIHPGFYRVRISKKVDGVEIIPERYNTKSELGHEEAEDKEGVGFVRFKLESE